MVALFALLFLETHLLLFFAFLGVWFALSVSVFFQKLSVSKIVWNLDRSSMKLLCNQIGWLNGEAIKTIHLLPWLCFFRVKVDSGELIDVCVFPDSVSEAEYRRLKIALKLGKMTLTTKAIQS
jgi:hypothetical protein